MDEKKEKKTLKERVSEAKRKTKEFWEEHKVAIIKGAVATAVTVGGIVLFKKASDALEPGDPLELDKLDVASGGGTIEQKDLIAENFWKENDMDAVHGDIQEHLRAIDDICNDKGVVCNISAGLGGGDEFENDYVFSEYYKDGSYLRAIEQEYRR